MRSAKVRLSVRLTRRVEQRLWRLTLALILLLETSEDHLSAGDVLGGVEQVLEEGVVIPDDTCDTCQRPGPS